MKDLSILIPARNEMFLSRTIEDILANIEADTEVITVLDGVLADPPIPQHERVNVIYLSESIGQRAATNLACKLSNAKYVMKCDAHCSFDKGFDLKMIEAFKETGEKVGEWKSKYSNIDIRHRKTLTPIKMTLKSFRHKPTGWKESTIDKII